MGKKTNPEIHSLRLSDAETYSVWCASSEGIMLDGRQDKRHGRAGSGRDVLVIEGELAHVLPDLF